MFIQMIGLIAIPCPVDQILPDDIAYPTFVEGHNRLSSARGNYNRDCFHWKEAQDWRCELIYPVSSSHEG